MAEVRAHARNFLLGSEFDEEAGARVVMALDEACTNILRHPCDPQTIKGRNWDDIRPGGLGVPIIQEVFDRVEYSPQARGTKLTLEKLFPTGPL